MPESLDMLIVILIEKISPGVIQLIREVNLKLYLENSTLVRVVKGKESSRLFDVEVMSESMWWTYARNIQADTEAVWIRDTLAKRHGLRVVPGAALPKRGGQTVILT